MDRHELQARRQRLGLSQAGLARLLGIEPSTVSRWEAGERAIQTPTMLRLALERIEEGKHARPTG